MAKKQGKFTIAGLPVEDADTPLSISITKNDILHGNTKDPGACAAARCICRMPYVEEARVHVARTYVKMNGRWLRYATPQSLRQEIVSFDRGGTFQPGEYELSPVPEWFREKRGEAHSLDTNENRGKTGKKRHKPHKLTGVRHDALRK